VKAMVLAAGKGERMQPLTLETPKPLLQAGGKSLIQHQIEKLAHDGFKDLIINHAWLGEQIESALGNGEGLGVSIQWSREGEPLETAGGIIQAMPLLDQDQPFVCVNADIWTDFTFRTLRSVNRLASVNGQELLAWLVLVTNPAHHPEGDFVLDGDRIREPEVDEPAFTYSGIAAFHPALFKNIDPGKRSVVPLLKAAMKEGRVGGEFHDGAWFDIGTPERLQALDQYLADQTG